MARFRVMGGVVMPVKNVPRETAVGRLLAPIERRSSSRMVFHVKRDDMVPVRRSTWPPASAAVGMMADANQHKALDRRPHAA